VVSICTGAFVLAAAGLLDGKIATTHWMDAPALSARFPSVSVDPGVLYIDEGTVLTSAGIAAGIDLCLHLVRKDFGSVIANAVARRLVVAPHRSGGQAQFVVQPVAAPRGQRLEVTRSWVLGRLAEPLTRRADGKVFREESPNLRAPFLRGDGDNSDDSPALARDPAPSIRRGSDHTALAAPRVVSVGHTLGGRNARRGFRPLCQHRGLSLRPPTLRVVRFTLCERRSGHARAVDPTRRLVAVGPYRYLRNPMISGVVTMLAGEGIFLGSRVIATWGATFIALNQVYFMLFEEPGLERRFGAAYREYKSAVPRWVPKETPWKLARKRRSRTDFD